MCGATRPSAETSRIRARSPPSKDLQLTSARLAQSSSGSVRHDAVLGQSTTRAGLSQLKPDPLGGWIHRGALTSRRQSGSLLAMGAASKRSTIYLPPDVHRALRLKAAAADRSISDLVSEAVRLSLSEDAEDLEAFERRSKERSLSFETVVKALRRRGKL